MLWGYGWLLLLSWIKLWSSRNNTCGGWGNTLLYLQVDVNALAGASLQVPEGLKPGDSMTLKTADGACDWQQSANLRLGVYSYALTTQIGFSPKAQSVSPATARGSWGPLHLWWFGTGVSFRLLEEEGMMANQMYIAAPSGNTNFPPGVTRKQVLSSRHTQRNHQGIHGYEVHRIYMLMFVDDTDACSSKSYPKTDLHSQDGRCIPRGWGTLHTCKNKTVT